MQLAQLPEQELGRQDVARMHFACAAGLPGAEGIGIDPTRYLSTVDEWTSLVGRKTKTFLPLFEREPERFKHSRAYFCLLVMATTVQRNLGVTTTNKLNGNYPDLRDSRDLFLHGILEGEGGTCSSLPVLYAGIGRRLGYPLHLVHSPCHLFVRWDEPGGERLNFETTCQGFTSWPDSHYRTWPITVPEEEWHESYNLKSLTPREELSNFLIQRAHCLWANGLRPQAVEACMGSCRLAPHHRPHLRSLERFVGWWDQELFFLMPPPRPRLTVHMPAQPLAGLPAELGTRIVVLNEWEKFFHKLPEFQAADWSSPDRRSPRTGIPLGLSDEYAVLTGLSEPADHLNHQMPRRVP
jgi:hypothetical protein